MIQSQAEEAISAKLSILQQRAANSFRGHEKEAVIEIARSADLINALILAGSPRDEEQRLNDAHALLGVTAALQPFLAIVESDPYGVPWQRSRSQISSYFYSYLVKCGELVSFIRLARLERYGLATTRVSSGRVDIHLHPDSRERRNRYSHYDRSPPSNWAPLPRALRRRMHRYVETDSSYFIKYENDWDLVGVYVERAKCYARKFPEGECLPNNFIIGGRSFLDWKLDCEKALGRILLHIDFALLLQQKRPDTLLRDVLTMFSRKTDVSEVWSESGLAPGTVESTMRALTLRSDDLAGYRDSFETPACFYIGLGTHFVLLPCFGTLINPYFALFRHLRSTYRPDWDRGVDQREDLFRSDLAELFSAPRFLVPPNGYKIRRDDGSLLTDVDAVVCDRETGRLALVQLKWHDPYGMSLSERESRRKNLAHANQWIDRLRQWIGSRSSGEVAKMLGLKVVESDAAPELYVVTRYTAGFAGGNEKRSDAAWLSWGELIALKGEATGADPLLQIASLARELDSPDDSFGSHVIERDFQELTVCAQAAK